MGLPAFLAMLALAAPAAATDPAVEDAVKRAKAGDTTAMKQVGGLYYTGDRVEQDFEEAARWFRRAADEGDAEAQYDLAALYYRGEGVEKSRLEGARWLRRAARGGHAKATEEYAKLQESGELLLLAQSDPVGVFELQLEAAEGGEAPAQAMVGEMYLEGIGVRADGGKAVEWLTRAADQGDRDAAASLGSIYEEGRGVDADPAAAVTWFRKAAEAGHSGAQFNLGTMYMNGVGVPVDHTEAVMWLSMAADANSSARFLLYTQEKKIAPEAIEEGRRRAAARGATLRPITPEAAPASPAVGAGGLEPL
jgi:hypothetical protein